VCGSLSPCSIPSQTLEQRPAEPDGACLKESITGCALASVDLPHFRAIERFPFYPSCQRGQNANAGGPQHIVGLILLPLASVWAWSIIGSRTTLQKH
jgi:hypothetical protein